MSDFSFLVPGRLDQPTGGYLFDRHVIEGLRALGRKVAAVELEGRFPDADAAARAACTAALAHLPGGACAVMDGLALPGFVDCLAAEAQRLRLVGMIHHPLAAETGIGAEESRRYAALETTLLPLLRGVLCPSRRTAAAVIAYGVPRARVAITPPGTAKLMAPRRAGDGTLRLLSVGSLTPRKGHRLLVTALAELADLDWRLTCIGSLSRDPATTAAVRQATAAHGLAERIALAGEQPHDALGEAYAAADVFVLPSYDEGYGMALAEALAAGLPIVATMAGAIPETVPASAGLLVPPGDPAALAAALRRVIEDAGLRARLAAGAAAAGARLPDWGAAVRGWAAAFDRLAG